MYTDKILLFYTAEIPSKSRPVNVVYEDYEVKDVLEMQHNPSYAIPVPTQSSGAEKKEQEEKMADKEGDIVTYETLS